MTREAHSQTLRDALKIMSTLSHEPCMALPPEQLSATVLHASLMADTATDGITEELFSKSPHPPNPLGAVAGLATIAPP